MTLRRLIISLFFAVATLAAPAGAVPKGATLMGGDSDAQVVLENGTIGVLYVRAVYEALDKLGVKTLYLVADETSFKKLSKVTTSSGARSIIISLDKPRLKVLVRPTRGQQADMFLGHVVPSGEKVYVLTGRAADRWQ